jgi:hypothetical protein
MTRALDLHAQLDGALHGLTRYELDRITTSYSEEHGLLDPQGRFHREQDPGDPELWRSVRSETMVIHTPRGSVTIRQVSTIDGALVSLIMDVSERTTPPAILGGATLPAETKDLTRLPSLVNLLRDYVVTQMGV